MEATGEEAKVFSQVQNFTNYGGGIRPLMLDEVCTLPSWLSLDIAKCDEAKFRGFPTVLLKTGHIGDSWRAATRFLGPCLAEHIGLDKGCG